MEVADRIADLAAKAERTFQDAYPASSIAGLKLAYRAMRTAHAAERYLRWAAEASTPEAADEYRAEAERVLNGQ